MKIALISCSKSKRNYRCKAKELYAASELFSVSYQYAKALNVDAIYILSAKHGLIHEDTLVDPYEFSMESLPPHRQIDWANYVKTQMAETLNPSSDTFVVLTGMDYLKPLLAVQAFGEYSFPLRGMRFGERIAFMNREIERLKAGCFSTANQCELLHKLFNQQKIYTYSQIDSIEFENGIYIVFEKGERYGQYNRIVRVGTHTSPNRLKNRLRDHYIRANKDGSIFRKNIGKALLNRRHDGYLRTWNYDTSKPENKGYVVPVIQSKIEEEVSAYLQENTFFTVFFLLFLLCGHWFLSVGLPNKHQLKEKWHFLKESFWF